MSLLEWFVFAAALGLGLLGYLMLGIGVMGFLRQGIMWTVVGTLLFIAAAGIWYFTRVGNWRLTVSGCNTHEGEVGSNLSGKERNLWNWVPAVMIGFCAVVYFILALAPVHTSDSLVYHFAAPKLFVRRGQIIFFPAFYYNLPMNMEMLFALGMLVYKDTVGLLMNYTMGLLCAMAIYLLAWKHFDRYSALLAAAVFYAMPVVIYNSAAGANDFGPILYTVLAFCAFLAWRREEPAGQWLLLSGVFSGLSAATKYTGLYTPVVLGALVSLGACRDHFQSTPGNRILRHFPRSLIHHPLFIFLVSGAVAGSPWYLRNWIVTGNPIWPMLWPILGGEEWNMAAHLSAIQKTIGFHSNLGRSVLDLMVGPLRISADPELIQERGGFGPFYSAIAPLVFLLGRRKLRRHGWILLLAFIFYLIWFPLSQVGRFLLPAVALLSVIVADVTRALIQKKGILRWVCSGVLAVGFTVQLVLGPLYAQNFFPVVTGTESRDKFLQRKTAFYEDLMWMNKYLPKNAVVLTVASTHLYYLNRAYIIGYPALQGFIDYSNIWSPEQLASQLTKLGITHVFVREAVAGRGHFDRLMQNFLTSHTRRIYHNPKGRYIMSFTLGHYGEIPVSIYEMKSGSNSR